MSFVAAHSGSPLLVKWSVNRMLKQKSHLDDLVLRTKSEFSILLKGTNMQPLNS